jgi:hypothetical protein
MEATGFRLIRARITNRGWNDIRGRYAFHQEGRSASSGVPPTSPRWQLSALGGCLDRCQDFAAEEFLEHDYRKEETWSAPDHPSPSIESPLPGTCSAANRLAPLARKSPGVAAWPGRETRGSSPGWPPSFPMTKAASSCGGSQRSKRELVLLAVAVGSTDCVGLYLGARRSLSPYLCPLRTSARLELYQPPPPALDRGSRLPRASATRGTSAGALAPPVGAVPPETVLHLAIGLG